MRGVIKKRLNAGFVAAIILVLLVGTISYATFQTQSEEGKLVYHTYKVINKLDEIKQILIDMETGRRGFRSTNEKKFLEPYYLGLQNYPTAINELQALIEDNPRQADRINKVKKDISELFIFWNNLGEDASEYTKDQIIGIMSAEKLRMDVIRRQLAYITKAEEDLLSLREKENAESIKFAKWELVIGILLILVIVIVLIFQILKEFSHRRKAEESVQSNLEELTIVNNENAERNWLLTGLDQINNILQSDQNEATLSENILKAIIKYLDLKAGAIYLYDSESKKLKLKASYSLQRLTKEEYALNEGFVGQAAASKEPLVLNNISPDYVTIQSGAVSIVPAYAVYEPLIHNNELKGVIEILGFNPLGDKILKFLNVITNNISVALHSLQARKEVLQLLEQVQEQKNSLENQQEELRQTNEELTVQAEVLQASEEELRVQEEELKQINDELKEKNQAIDNTRQSLAMKAAELESASKYKSEFLANMSHELRTPLNSVLILAKLLAENKDKNLTEKQVSHAKIIHKSGRDLLELINDILDLSKIEAGKVDLHFEEVVVKNIANDLTQLFNAIADEKSIEFTVEVDASVPAAIKTDRQKVEQVLKNLLSNAFKFTDEKGKVAIRFFDVAEDETQYIAISVSDSGIGIPEQKQKVIFEAFQQADGSTNRKFGGTGLGLSITKELVRMLKGKLKLVSEPGKGSTFTIYFPLDITEDVRPDPELGTGRQISFPTTIKEQTKIEDDRHALSETDKVMLIIEDDVNFASVLYDFAKTNGYKAVVALSGDEGWFYAKKIKPAAIILDLHVPVFDGQTLLKVFKDDPELKNVPVHVISTANDIKSLPGGAFAFLNKPVEKDDIEKAFNLISDHIHGAVKRVMIISKHNLKNEIENKIIKKTDVLFDVSHSVEEALQNLDKAKYDCIIADIGNNIDEGIVELNTLNNALFPQRIPTIIYLDNDITIANELELKRVADVVVRKSSFSNKRLLDELELFLYKVQEDSNKPGLTQSNGVNTDITLENKVALLVDDDMRNIFALSAALEQEKISVVTASNGKEALDTIESHKNIDIVLMDVMMPEMDGYEAISHIRNEMKLSKLPIIALTAKAMAGDRDKCIEAGASDYISKPVDMQKLISLLRVWLS
jgi:signal transduction histidine kinase/CheY-like chemotaxis protein/CHASE3 domain sensor protein